jgi:hypothetical protein
MRSSERLANKVTVGPQDVPEVDKYKFGRASNWNWEQLRLLGVRFNVKTKWNADKFLKIKGAYPAGFYARIHRRLWLF